MSLGRSPTAPEAAERALGYLLQPALPWQMRFGERFALEGILAQVQPRLAIEIGTAQGGSLARIAAHSQEVHSFDLIAGVEEPERFDNVAFHVGDSSTLLPEFLAELERDGRTVDFVLVDGDHTAEGVERDGRAILDSNACRSTVVVFHDAANEDVREGIVALEMEKHPDVALINLDFVPGYVVEHGDRRFEIWNGLALAVLDGSRSRPQIVGDEMFDAATVNRRFRDAQRAREEGSGDSELAPPQVASNPGGAEIDLTGSVENVPERFVPEAMGTGLVAAEHMLRYWMACGYADQRRVLDAGCGSAYGSDMLAKAGARTVVGIDIAAPVLEAARPHVSERVALEQGDIESLEYPADSFDLVVCFETIEHVDDPERALDELCRVLAPGGLLLISSPNRDEYVPGNPHHVHEYLPDEFREALAGRLGNVRLLRQHDWISSALMNDEAFAAEGAAVLPDADILKLAGRAPGSEVYTVAMASDAELPPAPLRISLTDPVELRRWIEIFNEQQDVLHAQADELGRLQGIDAERVELRDRLESAERRLASVPELTAATEAALRSERLLAERLASTERSLDAIQRSPSWRLTQPLRSAKRVLKRVVRP